MYDFLLIYTFFYTTYYLSGKQTKMSCNLASFLRGGVE